MPATLQDIRGGEIYVSRVDILDPFNFFIKGCCGIAYVASCCRQEARYMASVGVVHLSGWVFSFLFVSVFYVLGYSIVAQQPS